MLISVLNKTELHKGRAGAVLLTALFCKSCMVPRI